MLSPNRPLPPARWDRDLLASDENFAATYPAFGGSWDRRPAEDDHPRRTQASVRPMANKRAPPTTVNSGVPAITLFSSATFTAVRIFAAPEMLRIPRSRGLPVRDSLFFRNSVAHLLTRPGRPPGAVFHSALLEWHPGELVPRVGFIVTNLSRSAERVTYSAGQSGAIPIVVPQVPTRLRHSKKR